MERDDRREAAYCEAGWSLCHLLSGEAVDSHVEPPTSQRRGTRARGLLGRGVTRTHHNILALESSLAIGKVLIILAQCQRAGSVGVIGGSPGERREGGFDPPTPRWKSSSTSYHDPAALLSDHPVNKWMNWSHGRVG